jgi:hypothetical protein
LFRKRKRALSYKKKKGSNNQKRSPQSQEESVPDMEPDINAAPSPDFSAPTEAFPPEDIND